MCAQVLLLDRSLFDMVVDASSKAQALPILWLMLTCTTYRYMKIMPRVLGSHYWLIEPLVVDKWHGKAIVIFSEWLWLQKFIFPECALSYTNRIIGLLNIPRWIGAVGELSELPFERLWLRDLIFLNLHEVIQFKVELDIRRKWQTETR